MSEQPFVSAPPGVPLPSALDPHIGIIPHLDRKRLAVFLDYDGTLTPIVARPELALLSDHTRHIVSALAGLCPVAIISGRDRADVQRLVQIDTLYYAGSHGFDIAGPRGVQIQHETGADVLPVLDRAEAALHSNLTGIAGLLIERKKFSIAMHVRNVRCADKAPVEAAVDAVLTQEPQLRKGHGKKVFELQPNIDWHKGRAVRWLLTALALDTAEVVPLYIGDDVTDEDAFEALADDGISIVVAESSRPTAARYVLKNPEEVATLLQQLVVLLRA